MQLESAEASMRWDLDLTEGSVWGHPSGGVDATSLSRSRHLASIPNTSQKQVWGNVYTAQKCSAVGDEKAICFSEVVAFPSGIFIWHTQEKLTCSSTRFLENPPTAQLGFHAPTRLCSNLDPSTLQVNHLYGSCNYKSVGWYEGLRHFHQQHLLTLNSNHATKIH